MKVYIGKYKNWFGPYQLAEMLMFWVPKEKDEFGFEQTATRVHNFGEWLAHGSIELEPKAGETVDWDDKRPETWLYKLLVWIDSMRSRTIYVKIDRWDTWSMDHTLGHIILPMLKQLKETKHGSQIVDLEDVPEELRCTTHEEWEDQKTLAFYQEHKLVEGEGDVHGRWDWVLNEMIWAFEQHMDDNADSQFHKGKMDAKWLKLDDEKFQLVKGENDNHKFDVDGYLKWQERKSNGFRLFGKYYQGLWD